MKNIKYIISFCLALGLFQFGIAQNGANGRTIDALPKVKNTTTTPQNTDGPQGEIVSDQDIPTYKPVDNEHTFYPLELDIIADEMDDNTAAQLSKQMTDLALKVEALQKENELIRNNLKNCCSTYGLELDAKDAYLLQNAPNPFNQASEIKYYVPEGLSNVAVHICDISGKQLKQFAITTDGFGTLEIDAAPLSKGSYIYTLSVDDVIIDSKVMIITK